MTKRIVLRLSRNIQEAASQKWQKRDGEILDGLLLDEPIIFSETGLLFEADVLRGQKTGFFLDQRENRRKVGALASGRTVLNAFSFTGGFFPPTITGLGVGWRLAVTFMICSQEVLSFMGPMA